MNVLTIITKGKYISNNIGTYNILYNNGKFEYLIYSRPDSEVVLYVTYLLNESAFLYRQRIVKLTQAQQALVLLK